MLKPSGDGGVQLLRVYFILKLFIWVEQPDLFHDSVVFPYFLLNLLASHTQSTHFNNSVTHRDIFVLDDPKKNKISIINYSASTHFITNV